jgi:hypothetical protein
VRGEHAKLGEKHAKLGEGQNIAISAAQNDVNILFVHKLMSFSAFKYDVSGD